MLPERAKVKTFSDSYLTCSGQSCLISKTECPLPLRGVARRNENYQSSVGPLWGVFLRLYYQFLDRFKNLEIEASIHV